jgi:hypothetical protein
MSAEERAAFIEQQRQALFGACAVISVCAHAAIDQGVDRDELAEALQVAHRMVDDVAAKLEALTKI